MEVRIKFNASVVIKGKNLSDIRSKWENLSLWSEEAQKCSAEFCEVELVDDENYNDLTSKFEGYEEDSEVEDEDDDDNWIESCPQCNHQFTQWEHNYNDKTHHLDYKCPKCGWAGNEKEISYVR